MLSQTFRRRILLFVSIECRKTTIATIIIIIIIMRLLLLPLDGYWKLCLLSARANGSSKRSEQMKWILR